MDDHVSDAVGRPDLVRLDDGLVCLRFETMKVLSADAAVAHLLERGVVRPGDTLLDSSSGIYAYALALAAHRHGLRCHIVGSTTVDPTVRVQLEILGVRLDQMPPSDDLQLDQHRRVALVHQLLEEHPDYHWMQQYHDDVHYLGYRAVADRVLAELDGEPGADRLRLVGGVGSGASTGGLAGYLRESVDVELVGVQPFGSITFDSAHVDDREIIIAGIGSSIPFGNVDHSRYDTIHYVGFDVALAGAVDLLRRHAVFAGLSTGAAYLAARWEQARDLGRTALVIAADTGNRYVDSVFARHREAAPVTDLAPRVVAGTDELALPWSRLAWDGAPAPAPAVAGR